MAVNGRRRPKLQRLALKFALCSGGLVFSEETRAAVYACAQARDPTLPSPQGLRIETRKTRLVPIPSVLTLSPNTVATPCRGRLSPAKCTTPNHRFHIMDNWQIGVAALVVGFVAGYLIQAPTLQHAAEQQHVAAAAAAQDERTQRIESVRQRMPYWPLPGCDRPFYEWSRAVGPAVSDADLMMARWIACQPPQRPSN